MHRSLKALSVALVLLALMLAAAPLWAAPELHEHVMAPMADGTKLATDVYLPGEPRPYPVILLRSTYGRKAQYGESFLKDGYAVVIQDVRGMGDSKGEAHVFHADGWRPNLHDGADTVAWIKAQPWSNGIVGTCGGSALGMTQMLLAPVAKGVGAQHIDVAPSDFYRDTIFQGGVWRRSLVEGWLTAIKQPHVIDLWKAHPYYDEFWSYYDAEAKAADITSPALFVGGWYDIFQQGTIDGFVSRETQGGEGAKGKNYLIMKWSSHGRDITKDYELNENRFDLRISHVRNAFLDAYLKGEEDALAAVPKVHYYVFGDDSEPDAPGNEWRTAAQWPPVETTPTALHLGQDGRLSAQAPSEEASLGFTFDPKDPYPTHGGANLLLPSGAFDQREKRKGRSDLLEFATPPLGAPLEVIGRIKVKLWISSDAPDTDFTAKLLDLYPEGDGREILVLDNIQRVKMREDASKPAPLLEGPGQIVPIEIDLWSIAWVFNKGHRIGLHISSSNAPKYEVNCNTGADHPAPDAAMRVAKNRIHMGKTLPSALVLPVHTK